jgi:hypothetical protein
MKAFGFKDNAQYDRNHAEHHSVVMRLSFVRCQPWVL